MKSLRFVALILFFCLRNSFGQDPTSSLLNNTFETNIIPKLKDLACKQVSLRGIISDENGKITKTSAGILQEYANILQQHGVEINPEARIFISGIMSTVLDKKSNPPQTMDKLTIQLKNDSKVLSETSLLLFDSFATPINVSFPPSASPSERATIIAKAKSTQSIPQKGSITWNKEGTIGIEMLLAKTEAVMKANQVQTSKEDLMKLFFPRHLDDSGRVPTKIGESAVFRIINKNRFSIAGELRIAGVDWSEFADDKKKLVVIVSPSSETIIRGFYRNPNKSMTFDVSSLPLIAAGRQNDTGIVSFRYSAAWKKGDKQPSDEPETLGTIKIKPGSEQKDKFEIVDMIFGKSRGVISFEYGDF